MREVPQGSEDCASKRMNTLEGGAQQCKLTHTGDCCSKVTQGRAGGDVHRSGRGWRWGLCG